jgi:anti-sigma regulatory factor (Ser/Thr protein kinase)
LRWGSGDDQRAFRGGAAALREARHYVRDRADAAGLEGRIADDLVLAVAEACANALRHSGHSEAIVRWKEHPEGIEVEVEDRGVFPPQLRLHEPDSTPGFGLHLMTILADEFCLQKGTAQRPGTVVRIHKRTVDVVRQTEA